ncbi:MAG TPA: GNAT family N-acetyltransferase [Oculatellaceae cyanobacterium]
MPDTHSSFHIIQADVEHLDDAAILFDQYRQFYGQSSNLPAAKHFLFERTINKESVIYLAIDSSRGQAVGFMQLYPSFSSVSLESLWILNDLYVAPSARRRGIGRALMQTALNLAKQRGDKGICLSTTVSNTTAQRLYESMGFQQDREFLTYFNF